MSTEWEGFQKNRSKDGLENAEATLHNYPQVYHKTLRTKFPILDGPKDIPRQEVVKSPHKKGTQLNTSTARKINNLFPCTLTGILVPSVIRCHYCAKGLTEWGFPRVQLAASQPEPNSTKALSHVSLSFVREIRRQKAESGERFFFAKNLAMTMMTTTVAIFHLMQ